jgi:hypothetical protein
MCKTIDNSLIRKRAKSKISRTFNISYQDRDIASLLVRDANSLTVEEKNNIKSFYADQGFDKVKTAITDNQIVPFSAHIFMTLDCDQEYWHKVHSSFIERNIKIISLLDSVFTKMREYECKSLTLTENFAVVLSSNSCIGCFSSGDVDLSADINDMNKIVSGLDDLGFYSKQQPKSIGEYSGQSMQFYNGSVIDNGFWINVIWKPVTRAFLIQDKYDTRLANDRLAAKLVPNTQIRVLNDTSLMYFCALHIAAGHYYTLTPGLRLYVDIDRLARGCNIDWDDILKWAEEDNAGIRIAVIMYLSCKVFKTPIPKKVYEKALKNNRNANFIRYLYNSETNQIQEKSSKLRRLYVELASDDKSLICALMSRIMKFSLSK